MIRFVIEKAEVKKSIRGCWIVKHPNNGAILAYCDTEAEATRVCDALAELGRFWSEPVTP
jgi:hypothetical protein